MHPIVVFILVFSTILFILLITFVSMIISCKIKYKNYRKKFHKPSELDKYIKFIYTPEKHKKLLKLMKKLDKKLSERKVDYWITAGSLLGFKRNGGIIPWDDDIDICVNQKDIHKITDLLQKEPGWGNSLYKFKGDDVFIDIFPVDDSYRYIGKARQQWPNEYYDKPYPLHRSLFHDIEVSIPNETDKYLDRAYGEEWDKTLIQTCSHLHIPFCYAFLNFLYKEKITITEDISNIMLNMTNKVNSR